MAHGIFISYRREEISSSHLALPRSGTQWGELPRLNFSFMRRRSPCRFVRHLRVSLQTRLISMRDTLQKCVKAFYLVPLENQNMRWVNDSHARNARKDCDDLISPRLSPVEGANTHDRS